MSFEEMLVILGTAVFMPIMVISLILQHRRKVAEIKARGGGGVDNSVSITELEVLIEDNVMQAVEPLNRRIAQLEQGLGPVDLDEIESGSKVLGRERTKS